jgi:restriction system protein
MAIPKYDDIYKEVLLSIANGDIYGIEHIRSEVARLKGVTAAERAEFLESGKKIFDDRVNWARTYLKMAGLVDFPKRGFTQITAQGRVSLSRNLPIDNDFLQQYEPFRAFLSRAKSDARTNNNTMHDSITPDEQIATAFKEINASLSNDLLTEIMRIPESKRGVFFEELVGKLLVKMGYGDAYTVTPRSGDEGIDCVIPEDKLGFSNIYIQAKCWSMEMTIQRPEIQKFVGAIANKKGKGLFITTAKFSDGAKRCADENHIALIDGVRLTLLMIEYGLGVSTIQIYEIKKIDSDFFTEE